MLSSIHFSCSLISYRYTHNSMYSFCLVSFTQQCKITLRYCMQQKFILFSFSYYWLMFHYMNTLYLPVSFGGYTRLIVVLAIINKVPVNIHVFRQIYALISPRSRTVCLALVDMVKQFLKSCANLYSHQPCIRVPVDSHLQQIDTVNLLNFSYFDRFVVQWYFIGVLICIFLYEVETVPLYFQFAESLSRIDVRFCQMHLLIQSCAFSSLTFDVMDYINWFLNITPALYNWNKSYLIMMCNSFYTLLDSIS